MDKSEIVDSCKKHLPVEYESGKYILSGYKVEYIKGGTLCSVLLVDQRECKLWVDYKKVNKIERK